MAIALAELMDARYTKGMERPPIDLELWERASGVKKNYVKGLGQKRRYSSAETCIASSYSSQSSQTSPHPPPHTPADCLRAVFQDRRLLAKFSLHFSTLTAEDMALAAAEAATETAAAEAATTAEAEAAEEETDS